MAICAGEDRQIRLAMRHVFCTIGVVVLTAPALRAENGVQPGEFIIEPPTLICLGFQPASAKLRRSAEALAKAEREATRPTARKQRSSTDFSTLIGKKERSF